MAYKFRGGTFSQLEVEIGKGDDTWAEFKRVS